MLWSMLTDTSLHEMACCLLCSHWDVMTKPSEKEVMKLAEATPHTTSTGCREEPAANEEVH